MKDLPINGILFSSKDFEERAKEVLFIITPTISNYGVPNRDVVDLLRKKHAIPQTPDELHETLIGSMGELLGGTKEEAPVSDGEQGSEPVLLLDEVPVESNEPL